MKLAAIFLACAAVLAAAPGPGPLVLVAPLDAEIHPASADFIKRSIAEAQRRRAALFVVELSTPGGLMTSMREITTAIINSKIPVAVLVAPSGARAASAGFFILMSADVAAMAPGTNAGSAHPVGQGGSDIPETLNKKIEEDARAQLRTMCAAHHRDSAAAEKAVTESLSYTETEAKQKGLIDAIARDPRELCQMIDGRRLSRTDGASVELHLAGARFETLEMGTIEKALGAVSEPNVAYILFLIGLVGIYFELSHPGAILPGVAGGVSLLLALYAFSMLPVNFAAVGLIALGILFTVSEVKFPAHGMLAISGLVTFIAGSILLFAGNRAGYRVDLALVLPASLLSGGVIAALSIRAAAIRRRPVSTGPEGIVGERGKALSELNPAGKVLVHGEYWDARAAAPIAAGSAVKIVAKEGFHLVVEKADSEKGDIA